LCLWLAAAALLALALLGPWTAGMAAAEGSRDLYPSPATCGPNSAGGSCRMNIEWSTDAYGPPGSTQIRRRALFEVYAVAGEVLLMGSSAVAVGSGDIVVYNPGVITDRTALPLPTVTSGVNGFKCSAQRTASGIAAQGRIQTRAQELAGPNTVPAGGVPGGYTPCTYVAPQTGLYGVAFFGPNGESTPTGGSSTGDINLAAAANFNTTQGATVAAWDLTVRSSLASTTNLLGRMATFALAAITNSNGNPINFSVFPVTTDGFRYRVDMRGLDPLGFALRGAPIGFYDSDGVTPLGHDAYGLAANLASVAGGVTFAPAVYPVFLNPSFDPAVAAFGIPTTPTAPTISGFGFAGTVSGNTSTLATGGTFRYTSNVGGIYEIVLSRDGVSFDPGISQNRVLRGDRPAGAQTVVWDGLDNGGAPFPVGGPYGAQIKLRAGEYHTSLIDAENSTLGGPTLTMLNPPGGTCPLTFGCTTVFFDDRGYRTLNGTVIGTPPPPDTPLCGTNPPPAPYHSPFTTGVNSSGSARAYGLNTGGNTNVPCTGAFGDLKGMDVWTYFPSNVLSTPIMIIAPTPTPTATSAITPTFTLTRTPSATATSTATDTPSPTATGTATSTSTPTVTLLPSATPSPTRIPFQPGDCAEPGDQCHAIVRPAPASPTPLPTSTPVSSSTSTATPQPTSTPVPTATQTPTPLPTRTPLPTATSLPTSTPVPTATPSVTPAPTITPLPPGTPSPTPTNTLPPAASGSATPLPTATSSPTSVPTGTCSPTGVPSSVPTATPTAPPSLTSTLAPTPVPTKLPTAAPTVIASVGVGIVAPGPCPSLAADDCIGFKRLPEGTIVGCVLAGLPPGSRPQITVPVGDAGGTPLGTRLVEGAPAASDGRSVCPGPLVDRPVSVLPGAPVSVAVLPPAGLPLPSPLVELAGSLFCRTGAPTGATVVLTPGFASAHEAGSYRLAARGADRGGLARTMAQQAQALDAQGRFRFTDLTADSVFTLTVRAAGGAALAQETVRTPTTALFRVALVTETCAGAGASPPPPTGPAFPVQQGLPPALPGPMLPPAMPGPLLPPSGLLAVPPPAVPPLLAVAEPFAEVPMIPEAETWPLLGVGVAALGALGAARRRRRD
jgi:hypothetical protein